MTYISTVEDHSYSVDAGEKSAHRNISFEGTSYNVDWRQLAPLASDTKGSVGGHYSLILAGRSYDVFARRITSQDEKDERLGYTFEISLAGQRFEVHVEDEREKTLAGAAQSARETSEAMVRAPMPGLVLGLPLEVGASVERGQTVVILEAMKMENDLSAPLNGKIKEVRVSKGQTVNQGEVLVVITKE